MNLARLIALLAGRPRSLTTTWNPTDKASQLTLSNGNLTATSDNFFVTVARATTSKSTGKRAYSVTIVANGTATFLGFANGSAPLGGILGADPNAVGYRANTGEVKVNGVTLRTIEAMTAGDVADIVFDMANMLFWLRVSGRNWNADSSANPITGLGGISVASLTVGPYFPAIGFGSVTNHSGTANFFPSPRPGGVQAWDE